MSEHDNEYVEKSGEYQPRINEFGQKYLSDLEDERQRMLNKDEEYPLIGQIINETVSKVLSTGRIPGKEFYADVYKQKPIKITQKVFVPVKQFPKFNFTGKILGPKGNSLRRLQEETQCKIAIKGRNSMRDRAKEEELRESGDPRHSHLHKDLFIEISTLATPAEGYARMAYALAEIRKYIIPDKNDEVSQEQLREMIEMDPKAAKMYHNVHAPEAYKSVFDRKFESSSGSKYVGLVKRMSYAAQDHEVYEESPDAYEHEPPRYSKHSVPHPSSYIKASSTAAYKRPPQPPHISSHESKRFREAPVKSYRPAYAPMKKYS